MFEQTNDLPICIRPETRRDKEKQSTTDMSNASIDQLEQEFLESVNRRAIASQKYIQARRNLLQATAPGSGLDPYEVQVARTKFQEAYQGVVSASIDEYALRRQIQSRLDDDLSLSL